jgi:hypothetical protein
MYDHNGNRVNQDADHNATCECGQRFDFRGWLIER